MADPDSEGRRHLTAKTGRFAVWRDWSKRRRVTTAVALLMVIVIIVAATLYFTLRRPTLRIGVVTDEPGMSFQESDTQRTGFEIDMYRWMADNSDSKFNYEEVELTINNREFALSPLNPRQLDAVVASYTMTDYRRRQVLFSGPYFHTQQGVMVKADSPLRDIKKAEQLSGKTACAQSGSVSVEGLRRLAGGTVTVVERVSLRQCVDAMYAGLVDAVSTDQILLKGYAADDQTPGLTVPETAIFGTYDGYGVGVPLGNYSECKKFTERIQKFISSGAWYAAYTKNFGQNPPVGAMPQPADVTACDDPAPEN